MIKAGIIGAGPVGCLAALYLSRRGYKVEIYERRSDPRLTTTYAGRSINLALSDRGIRALHQLGLEELLLKEVVPMRGRMVHPLNGSVNFQPYGTNNQAINSVSRSGLNLMLLQEAEKKGVTITFEARCVSADLEHTSATFSPGSAFTPLEKINQQKLYTKSFDVMIAADGAYSAIRQAFQFTDRFDFAQNYIEHGYKELHIPPGSTGEHLLDPTSLHIWPREKFMLIALPNTDGSFTLTLFFPFEGPQSFAQLDTEPKALKFLQETFPDVAALIPDAGNLFMTNPTSSLHIVKCYPWVRNKTLLIGDAAHAIVPFYGQGMNAGFEDCRILAEMLEEFDDDWSKVLPAFQESRKPDADAIATLALDNFIEMRDLVADEDFVIRKKIEARLHSTYPEEWIPLYTMVTFRSDIRYSEAYKIGQKQKKIMDAVMARKGILDAWESVNLEEIMAQFREN